MNRIVRNRSADSSRSFRAVASVNDVGYNRHVKSFRNILFVSHGARDETDALRQAVSLVRNNSAHFTAAVVCPEYPLTLARYRDRFIEFMQQETAQAIAEVRRSIMSEQDDLPVTVHVECGSTPVVHLIQRVIRDGHDLIIKEAEPGENEKGFRAFDMELLRKCPCPVWLCRPIAKNPNEIRVGVAVDPDCPDPASRDLSIRLLTLANSLATTCNGELAIISCWEFAYEGFLRQNPWASIPGDEVRHIVAGARTEHRSALNALIAESGIGDNHRIHHARGQADEVIPTVVEQLGLDILVMGTVARTGIPGFFIGNTAENILQKIHCSLLALKPPGFVSPVKVS